MRLSKAFKYCAFLEYEECESSEVRTSGADAEIEYKAEE